MGSPVLSRVDVGLLESSQGSALICHACGEEQLDQLSEFSDRKSS